MSLKEWKLKLFDANLSNDKWNGKKRQIDKKTNNSLAIKLKLNTCF